MLPSPIAIALLSTMIWGISPKISHAGSTNLASSHNQQRNALQETYTDYRAKHPSLFATTPIFHIIPQRDIVTLSLDSQLLDTSIVPQDHDSSSADRRELHLDGWHTAALASFSAKSFGVGFSAELGEKNSLYESISSGSIEQQQSKTKFSGLGIYLYYMPAVRVMPKNINLNLIFGYRKLSVLHNFSGLTYNSPNSELQPFRYDLSTLDYGSNLSILLAKHFTVLPWINWRRVMIGKPEAIQVNGLNVGIEPGLSNFEADRELLWKSEPRVSFGLDLAVKLGPFNAHLGGLFGLIANFSKGSEQIEEQGFSASLTYSFRSR